VLSPYPYGTAGGPRSGLELWEPLLREVGIEFEYLAFETDRLHEILYLPGQTLAKTTEMLRSYARTLVRAIGSRDHDAVLVSREAALVGPALIERIAVRGGKPLIYVLDDPHYVPYRSPSNGLLSYLKFFGKVKSLCRMSAAVLANSPQHVEFARRYSDNVWEIPSVVDARLYTPLPPRLVSDTICVGWTGSPSTVPNLQVIRRPLEHLGRRSDVRLRFIGADAFGLDGIPYEGIPWRADTEVDDLRALDVGLLPLPDTPWTRRKLYLKLVQYMALGIPPVATPLGANTTMIEDGETGLLARDDAEWISAVERLVEDPELRARMGERAAEVAHRRYTLQANAEKIVAAFRSALD
jgi:glycosyltransferase involved in cell wall biosynthesis